MQARAEHGYSLWHPGDNGGRPDDAEDVPDRGIRRRGAGPRRKYRPGPDTDFAL
jgi:hypothetical protein